LTLGPLSPGRLSEVAMAGPRPAQPTPTMTGALNSKQGNTAVPWTVIGGAVVKGFDEARFKRLLCLG
jgi:hypothetical protein